MYTTSSSGCAVVLKREEYLKILAVLEIIQKYSQYLYT